MKILMENWRKYLNERKTDDVYQDILAFFVRRVLKIENFKYSIAQPASDRWFLPPFDKYESMQNRKEGIGDFTVTWAVAFELKEEVIKSLWLKYSEEVPLSLEVFDSMVSFRNALKNFKILLFQVDPFGQVDVGGGMDSKGVMYLYHRGKIDENFYKGTEVFNFYKSQLVKVLDHELTHFLNSVRSNFKQYRAKGGKKQFDVTSQEYVDSTEEIQARLIEAFRQFEREAKAGDSYWMEELTPAQFVEEFITKYYESDRDDRFNIENHSKQNQKRIRKRVYEYMKSVRKKYKETPDAELLENIFNKWRCINED